MKKDSPVSIHFEKSWLAILREKAHRQSLETGREIIYADLVRAAVVHFHPEVLEAELEMAEEREG